MPEPDFYASLDEVVVSALDSLWASLREQEPNIAPAEWYFTSGRSTGCGTGTWSTSDSQEPLLLRINLMRDGQNRTADDILSDVLHWAAHSAAGATTAAERRWHSELFGEVARKLGLAVAKGNLGWSPTGLARGTKTRYGAEIKALDKAMASWEPEKGSAMHQRRPLTLRCQCTPETYPPEPSPDGKIHTAWPRTIRTSTGIAARGRLICGYCNSEFVPYEP
jgi:hypothetical protein